MKTVTFIYSGILILLHSNVLNAGDRIICTDSFGKKYESCDQLYKDLDAKAIVDKYGKIIEKRFDKNKDGIELDEAIKTKADVQSPKSSGTVKVMSINIGTAALKTDLVTATAGILKKNKKIFTYDCPNLKLCNPELAQNIHDHFEKYLPDVILIQEAQGKEQLTLGDNLQYKEITNANGNKEIIIEKTKISPVLPSEYDVVCNSGHLGVIENCVAWNKNRAKLADTCRSIVELQGGAILCPLEIDQQEIQFVSSHPSAWYKNERAQTLASMWSILINRNKPAIVGGDFNNTDSTFGYKSDKPYPEEFYTLFGKHAEGYGMYPPNETFYGTYKIEIKKHTKYKVADVLHSTIYPKIAHPNQLDHVFANFGEPEYFTETDNACENKYACLGAYDKGYEYKNKTKKNTNNFAKTFFYKLDHRPIYTKISWRK